jgi:hypothetical protein
MMQLCKCIPSLIIYYLSSKTFLDATAILKFTVRTYICILPCKFTEGNVGGAGKYSIILRQLCD